MSVVNKNRRKIAAIAIYGGIAIWLGWFLFFGPKQSDGLRSTGVENKPEQAAVQVDLGETDTPPTFGVVTDVVDALTILIDDKYKIRYLGVTVPATSNKVECFGKEAVQANESMLGKTVKLEKDEVLTQARDGAWVRYVWVADDEYTKAAYAKALNGETVLGLTEPYIVTSPDVNSPDPSAAETADGAEKPGVSIEDEGGQAVDSLVETDGNNIAGTEDGLNGEDVTPKEEETPRMKEYMVSERIIEMGLGFPLLVKEMVHYDRLAAAARYSSATKRGLWGNCEISQDDNGLLKVQTDETCNIKGITVSNGDKVYRTPACPGYKDTVVLLYEGGEWLCSEEEATGSGYVKGADCK